MVLEEKIKETSWKAEHKDRKAVQENQRFQMRDGGGGEMRKIIDE